MERKIPRFAKLKAYFVEHGIKMQEVADLLGIDITTLSLKIHGKLEFTFPQVVTICKHYGINADEYFIF